MKENLSHGEINYLPRWITPVIARAVKDHPVVVMTGARQVGKSTFLRYAEPTKNWKYISFDDFDVLEQAQKDPQALWAGVNRVILDEVQKAPNVLSAVKREVDQSNRSFQAILSGSANLLLMEKVSETLAGRAVYFSLDPMTLGETLNQSAPEILFNLFKGELPGDGIIETKKVDPIKMILKGLMPPLLKFSNQESITGWWEGYVRTYLERDLRQISQVSSLTDFKRVMELVALRSGQLFHKADVSRDSGISQPTVHRYINLLETTSVLYRLPAFARNRTKRLVKSPKYYWIDSGLSSYLSGYFDADSVRLAREKGGFMETLILHHLRVLGQLLVPRPNIFYWRTTYGQEVDFILEYGQKLVAMEVKLTENIRYADCEGLRLFLEEYPETVCGVLLYTGNEVKRLDKRIVALPWTLLCGDD